MDAEITPVGAPVVAIELGAPCGIMMAVGSPVEDKDARRLSLVLFEESADEDHADCCLSKMDFEFE